MAESGKPQKLDMNAVWSRGMVLVRENRQLLGILAGVFLLLPSALVSFAIPPQGMLDGPMGVLLEPTSSEEAVTRAQEAVATAMAPLFVWSGIAQVIQHIGYAAMMALIGRNRPTVGGAIMQGLKAILPIILAVVVFVFLMWALLTVLSLVLVPLGQAVAAFFGAMLALLALLFLTARFSLTMPAIVIEGEMNPVRALLRSWKLTAKSAGNVFGFWMLVIVAYFVILVLVSAVAGLVAAMIGQGTGAMLVGGLIGGVFAAIAGIVICAIAVAMHAQLMGPPPSAIASEFD